MGDQNRRIEHLVSWDGNVRRLNYEGTDWAIEVKEKGCGTYLWRSVLVGDEDVEVFWSDRRPQTPNYIRLYNKAIKAFKKRRAPGAPEGEAAKMYKDGTNNIKCGDVRLADTSTTTDLSPELFKKALASMRATAKELEKAGRTESERCLEELIPGYEETTWISNDPETIPHKDSKKEEARCIENAKMRLRQRISRNEKWAFCSECGKNRILDFIVKEKLDEARDIWNFKVTGVWVCEGDKK